MLQRIFYKVFGTRHERELKKMQPLVDHIGQLAAGFEALSDDDLRARMNALREKATQGETLDKLLPECFALTRVASQRVLGMRHYDVQLIGGSVLHRGSIAEMRTGEGKTLTATLAMVLNALPGKGAHLVTVNEYLARRDAEWMGQLYGWLGLTTGVVVPQMSDSDRRNAYRCDITYGTNSEFGFDYLRDNMKYDLNTKVQRGLHFAIVDEVDSILIDEARTPLIISGRADQPTELYYRINAVVARLKPDEDYIVDEEHRAVNLTEEGITSVEKALSVENLYDPRHIELLHHINKALEAHTLFKRDEKYLVQDGKIVIIDEFTGRAMAGRRWSDGLHQAIEAKEGVKIEHESVTLATVTYQNFFRMYQKLSGMTGTADTEAEEFGKIYKLDVTVIPTNKPIARIDQPDLVYRTEREKFASIVDQILACHEKGQPVLIGTTNVDKSEVISKVLTKKGIAHSVLNAKFHEQEADIVAQAGRKGAVTIATNMAGRGTDILLGGNPEALARKVVPDEESEDFQEALTRFRDLCAREREEVLAAGGLFILGTERHESRRIDNQLRGRAGRQGDPGESRFFLSLDDELMRRFGMDRIQGMMQRLGMEEGMPIEHNMVTKQIENAQRRMEGRNFDIRKNLLEYDDVMDLQRKTVYALRDRILAGEELEELVLDVLDEALAATLGLYANPGLRPDDWDMEGMAKALKETFALEFEADTLPRDRSMLERNLWQALETKLSERITELEPVAEAFNARFAEDATFERKTGKGIFYQVAQSTYLQELDRRYRDHLQAMRALREAVSLHGFAQKDPKQIYKKEGFDLFATFRHGVTSTVASYLMRFIITQEDQAPPPKVTTLQQPAAQPGRDDDGPPPLDQASTRSAGAPPATAPAAPRMVRTKSAARRLPGRNDPCWCGSGKKYKHCHMRQDAESAGAPDLPTADEIAKNV